MKVGKGTFEFTDHALGRAAARGISLEAIHRAMNEGKRFDYFHDGTWKVGFYDRDSGVFVGTVGDTVLTVITVSDDYIQRLLKVTP